MLSLNTLLISASKSKSSDIHLTAGLAPVMRLHGAFVRLDDNILTPLDTKRMAEEILTQEQKYVLHEKGEVDLAYSIYGVNRYRINVFMQRNAYALAIRLINHVIPSFSDLGLPDSIAKMTDHRRGLILVTGPTGSGKSTTLACMIDKINRERENHIITLEEPIEYLHSHNKSIVNQREIGEDSKSFSAALRSALRQDPDVILIGEMRDVETIATALTAAETGHLVLSTLHTVGAAKTIDRIIDVFPPFQQQQVRFQLSTVLQGVVSQQLLTKKEGNGRAPAVEIMTATPAIKNLIRETKVFQINNVIQTSLAQGMISMDQSLLDLYHKRIISAEDAINYAVNPEYVMKTIRER